MLSGTHRVLIAALVPVVLIGMTACAPTTRVEASFTVEGMTCESCSSAIGETLSAVDGVESASADHIVGSATAVFLSPGVSLELLVSEIEGLGYTVTATRTAELEG